MRSSFTVDTGLKLVRTTNYRRQATRRRWMAGGAVVALLVVGGVLGAGKAPENHGVATAAAAVSSQFATEENRP